jgi:hypothetical protein
VAEWHARDQALAAAAAAVRRREVGLGPGLVDEDEPAPVEALPLGYPGGAAGADVGAVQLGGGQRLFLRVMPSRAKKRRIEP